MQAVTTNNDKTSALSAVGQTVAELTEADLVIYYGRDSDNNLAPNVLAAHAKSPRFPLSKEPLYPCAKEACAQGCPKVDIVDHPHRTLIIGVPVQFRGRAPEAIVAVYRTQNGAYESLTYALQLAAVHITLWQVLQDWRKADFEAQASAALQELLARLGASRDMTEACQMLARELRRELGCRQVAVGLCRRENGRCRLQAVSGVEKFDKHSALSRALESALQEAIIRDSLTLWPPPTSSDRRAALTHHKLCAVANVGFVMSTPLRLEGGEAVGACVFLGEEVNLAKPVSQNFIRASETKVASCLFLLRGARSGVLSRITDRVSLGLRPWRRRVILSVLGVALAGLLVPMPYKIGCDGKLEPVSRRFVAAPYDGILEKVFAGPGDTVAQGELLARMDGREIRWDLAGVIAERDRAAKQKNAAFAKYDFAAVQVAKLEVERLELKKQTLENREQNLEVKSPIDGVVTVGDLDRAVGAPVTRGQALFEVAPLTEMTVELAIPEDEIDLARKGLETAVRLDSYPDETWYGTIEKIHPRAEIRDNRNVFVGQFTLANSDGRLRPGMLGRAKIAGPRRPLIWNLVRKPWQWLRFRLGW